MAGIFISYRREDSFAYAGRLYDHLANHFGKENVFMDVDNIELGLDFVEVLQQTVSSCDALVAVIGNQWLAATDEQGCRRLDNPEDLVRLEIAAALDRKVRVVPALVAGAHMPHAQDLPQALASLSRRNALEISDTAFHQSVRRLIDALEKTVRQMQPAGSPPHALAPEPPQAQPVQISARQPAPALQPNVQNIGSDARTAKRDAARLFGVPIRWAVTGLVALALVAGGLVVSITKEQKPSLRPSATGVPAPVTGGVEGPVQPPKDERAGGAGAAKSPLVVERKKEASSGTGTPEAKRTDAPSIPANEGRRPNPAEMVSSAPAVQTKINPADGQPYVWIAPGSFRMGCSDGDSECYPDESPAHPVTMTKGFWMGRTEVTVAAYRKFAQTTGRSAPSSTDEDHPVANGDWNDASAYCKWAGGRLPSEAEWEYAARAGSGGARYGELDRIAWYKANSGGHTNPVGKKTPNRFGLYDMLGNVWEWCADWYADSYSGSGGQTDPAGPSSGTYRVLRGGSWFVNPRDARASLRPGSQPGNRFDHYGIRCVREVIP